VPAALLHVVRVTRLNFTPRTGLPVVPLTLLRAVPVTLCAVLAAGCIGSADVSAAPRGRAAGAEVASAEVAGKPVAPFSVRTEVVGTPAVGQPLEVRIIVRPSVPVTDLVLDAAGDASLEVAAADAKQTAPSATRGAPAEWSVSVVPRAAGELRLKITVDGVIEGVRQARSIVAPIRVTEQTGVEQGALEGAGSAAESAGASDAASAETAEAKSSATRTKDQGNDGGRQGDGLIHLHSDE
jgi:hypothetical protein